ncbi:uncharacterized protein LOC144649302 isoform X2 [Oculina patagonica]
MAAERPRRRITHPCLEYNGGLLHKEELMLRRAMYASLVESKKTSPSKLSQHHSTTSNERTSDNDSRDSINVNSDVEEINSNHCKNHEGFDNNNKAYQSEHVKDAQCTEAHVIPSVADNATSKNKKGSKEPSKLQNYVIKKKKEKKTKLKGLLRTTSPSNTQTQSDASGITGFPTNKQGAVSSGKAIKKKKRQRGALAVFVAMNKSAGGKLNNNHGLDKELLLKNKKKRRRKRKNLESQAIQGDGAVNVDCGKQSGVESEESPVKKSRKEERKKPSRMVHAQRKFAKNHPLSPTSMRYQEERNLLTSACTSRAKTEDFLTFLCLRNNPVLPKELEVFNHPCLPMSPLSEEEDDNSSPPSPTQSQSSMSNSSNLSSAVQKSFTDSPAPSVDSPAMGEGPSWESGVVRMFADGPKGLAGKGKDEKKYDELLPSDEADSPRELTKSVTPPLAFRVSSRPTNLSPYRTKDKQLPRPIPKPFAVKPLLTGSSATRTSFSPLTGNTGGSTIPPPPPLLQSSESSSCSPPPPPLLYIPAAAQRVTHLREPPTLQRFPSTSPTRDQESDARAELPPKLSIIQDDGPPPLKRFPPVVIEHEDAKKNESNSSKPFLTQESSSEFNPRSVWSLNKKESKAGATAVSAERSSTSLSDLTKISEEEPKTNRTGSPWSSKEMPLLRRHSSASEYTDVRAEELSHFSGMSRAVNSSSSPPRLERVADPVDTGIQAQPGRVESSGGRGETSRNHIDSAVARFPSHPPILVRHSTGYPDASVSRTSLQKETLTSGGCDSNRRQPSPFGDLASSGHENAQSLQERNYARPIPVVDPLVSARHSPLFMSYGNKYKSTYVFSNRQTFSQAENEPRPVQVSSLVMPSKNGVRVASTSSEVNSMRFQSVNDGFGRSDERQHSRSVQSQYAGPSSYIHQSYNNLSSELNTDAMTANGQFNNSPVGFKRIPSPRSDLFSGISPKPVNTACISHVDVPFRGSLSSGNQPRSTIGQKEHALDSLPPTWSHLESPYSILSTAPRNSPPKPYTFSVNFSQSSRQSGTYSVSNSSSKSGILDGYSLRPMEASDGQHAPVIQRASISKGEPLSSIQHELCVGEQENFRTYNLPKAFQGGDSRPESSSSAFLNDVASRRDHLHVMQPYLNDHNTGSLNRETSSPLAHHTFPARTPSLDLTNLKERKDKVLDSTVTGSTAFKSNSSPKVVKKTLGSKRKDTCPSLEKTNDSPVFHPSEEEFQDPVAYIKKIRCDAEKFGVCVIVPPESWKPEFQVPDNVRFNSECQLIHRLQDRWGPVEEELACIRKHLEQQSISLVPMPQIGGYEIDLPQFSRVVKQFGGLQKVIDSKKWTKIADILKIPRAAQDRIGKLQDIYCKYLLSYDLLPKEEKAKLLQEVQTERENNATCEQDAVSWSVKGRSFSLVPFQRLARNVQGHFFKNPPSANDVEREFWRFVHNRETYVSVHRGTVDTNQENSCFPTDKGNPYSKLGWNLNVLPHLPGSVLKHLGFVQDVTVPWIHFDMVFSVKQWQTHPLALYTVEYLHSGADKIWYSVSAGEKKKFESLFGQHDNAATDSSRVDKMVSPSSLNDSGLTVTRVVQKQGQFVIVFPEAYHSSVSCGFSISEAVAFAPPDWLMIGSKRYKDLQGTSWWSEFTYDRLLLGLAKELNDESREVLECLLSELKSIRDEEKAFMVQLLELGLVETVVDSEVKSSGSPGGKKSITNWPQADSSCILYCEDCDRPCYLSAVTSEDEPQVLCLKHAVEHIREKASPEGFRILSRHDTCQLDELVYKVEEKLQNLQATPS